jgi:hypothetical protein
MLDRNPLPAAQPHAQWSSLVPGRRITVIKLAPDGSEAARYPGVIAARQPDAWLVVRATWSYREVELDGLSFLPGDQLLEWFSPNHYFNAFAIFSSGGDFSGWYANVAMPAFVRLNQRDDSTPELVWHDLYLDLVGLPGGGVSLRDEDELRASPLAHTDPALFETIIEAGEELRSRFVRRGLPFAGVAELRQLLDSAIER